MACLVIFLTNKLLVIHWGATFSQVSIDRGQRKGEILRLQGPCPPDKNESLSF
jgi:hypothetical protein